MDDKQLLQNLISAGLLTQESADKIVKDAALLGKKAEEIIYERNIVPEAEAVKVKSKLLNIPYQKVDIDQITKDLLSNISQEVARTYKVIPLSKTKDMLVVGMLRPDEEKAKEPLRFIAQQQHIKLRI